MEPLDIAPWLRELNRLLRENDSLYRKAARSLGLPECTLWILYALRADGQPVTQAQLCQTLHEPKTTINSALKHMQAQEWIVLTAGEDRRTRSVTLTEKGMELARRTADRLIHAEENALFGLSTEQREGLFQGMRRFNQELAKQFGAPDAGKKTDQGGGMP